MADFHGHAVTYIVHSYAMYVATIVTGYVKYEKIIDERRAFCILHSRSCNDVICAEN